jgi:hypothetical protein|tara:strand:+ start:165 stop:1178 length:1014 start_codon:yes stop_codon:yes gene_type:complete
MPYIGTSPSNGVRRVFDYTATAGQTSFSGTDNNSQTLSYSDSNFIDVFQNGILLLPSDYTATTGTTVVLDTGATVSDSVQIVAFDVFSVADTVSKADGGTFDGNVTMAGTLGVTGVPTFTGRSVHSGGITVANDGQIGSTGDADAMAISSSGVVTFSQNTVGAGGMDLLYTLTSSSSVTSHDISSTYINSTYDNYSLVGYFEGDADGRYLQAQVFVGGTVQTGNIYGFSNMYFDSGDAHSNAQGEPNLVTFTKFGMGGEDGEGTHINAVFQNANNTQAPFSVSGFATRHSDGANHAGAVFSGSMLVANRANVVNGLRFKMHSGNINYAKFKLYGLRD